MTSFELETALSALLVGQMDTMRMYDVTQKQLHKNFTALLKKNQFGVFLKEVIRKWIETEGEDFVMKQFTLSKLIIDAILASKKPGAPGNRGANENGAHQDTLPQIPQTRQEPPQIIRPQPTVQVPEQNNQYSQEIKDAAVRKYLESRNFSETAIQFGISDIFEVVRWVKEYESKISKG